MFGYPAVIIHLECLKCCVHMEWAIFGKILNRECIFKQSNWGNITKNCTLNSNTRNEQAVVTTVNTCVSTSSCTSMSNMSELKIIVFYPYSSNSSDSGPQSNVPTWYTCWSTETLPSPWCNLTQSTWVTETREQTWKRLVISIVVYF